MKGVIAIVGPTGVGKSRLAIRLARQFGGEIVNADSRQVYRHMDIGTAKPTPEEQSQVRHHLIDIVNPDEDFSLAQYQSLAYQSITDINQRDRLAFLVGGSGQYVWAVVEGWRIPPIPPDPEFRRGLTERARTGDGGKLYEELLRLDPVAASRIDRRNVRRVIRALEVSRHGAAPLSRVQYKEPPTFRVVIVGLTLDRVELYRRIDARVDEMIKRGLIDEVRNLVDMGYGLDLPAMSGIGYRQIGQHLQGELKLGDAIQQIKHETRRFVRHQYNWFRLNDQRIHWFDVKGEVESEITELVTGFMSGE